MTDLPHVLSGYIQVQETQYQAAVSEATAQKIGSSINALIDSLNYKSAIFSGAQSVTWTVPLGTTVVDLESIGGGGGGAGAGASGFDASGGGAGLSKIITRMNVTPGAIINIVVGSGGAGGVHFSTGGAGSDTSFNGITLCKGAPGGNPASGSFPTVATAGPTITSANINYGGGSSSSGCPSENFNGGGGAGSPGPGSGGGGGGGGASSYGAGGNAVNSGTAGAGGGYGAGGGGAGGVNTIGGRGGDGQLIIWYLSPT